MGVAMDLHARPGCQLRWHIGKRLQQRLFDTFETLERHLARRAMGPGAGLLHHPGLRLPVGVVKITEFAKRKEARLHVFDARFDNSFFSRVPRRTWIDLEQVPFGALRVSALDFGFVDTGLDDGTLGVIYDDASHYAIEPFEGMTVT